MAKAETRSRPKRAASNGRVRKLTKKQIKAKAKKEISKRARLPGSFSLVGQVFQIFKNHWKKLGGIILIYLVLNVIFASGISDINATFSNIKDELNAYTGNSVLRAATSFLTLAGSAGASGSATGSTLQMSLFILESLVIIWALRHLLAGETITVKRAYYESMSPLVPFLIVIFVILLQLLPVTVGTTILVAVFNTIFTSTDLITVLSIASFILLASWSFYMICASIFALYIVTLQGMHPRQALRSAKDLVRFRHWVLLRKLLFLPLFILLVMAAVMIPLILFLSYIVPWVFYVLSMLAILFVHSYLYSLYRSLLE